MLAVPATACLVQPCLSTSITYPAYLSIAVIPQELTQTSTTLHAQHTWLVTIMACAKPAAALNLVSQAGQQQRSTIKQKVAF
jgi:hypothetical protein